MRALRDELVRVRGWERSGRLEAHLVSRCEYIDWRFGWQSIAVSPFLGHEFKRIDIPMTIVSYAL